MGDSNIKFGVSGSVKLEVKTEVPADASGRLVHAALDAVSPLTEWLGMHGDKMRIHRKQVVQKLVQRSEEQLALEQRKPLPAPLKVVVPIIEHASQEDIDDEFMIDRWAMLLASATREGSISPYFVSLLSNLSSRQAQLLMDFASPRLLPLSGDRQDRLRQQFRLVFTTGQSQPPDGMWLEAERIMRNAPAYPVCAFAKNGPRHDYIEDNTTERLSDLQILEALRLIQWHRNSENIANVGWLTFEYCVLAPLGDEFLHAVVHSTATS